MEIDDVIIRKFAAKAENGKLNIYKPMKENTAYFILFLAGIMPWVIDILFPVHIFLMFLIPLIVCSIIYAIAMYFFRRSFIYALEAFVVSFVAVCFILIMGISVSFLIPPLIFAGMFFVSRKKPDLNFPFRAFISIFFIPIFLNFIFFIIISGLSKT